MHLLASIQFYNLTFSQHCQLRSRTCLIKGSSQTLLRHADCCLPVINFARMFLILSPDRAIGHSSGIINWLRQMSRTRKRVYCRDTSIAPQNQLGLIHQICLHGRGIYSLYEHMDKLVANKLFSGQ